MSMVKIVSPSGWDFDRPIAVPVKIGSRGLVGADRREFLKTASHLFLPFVDELAEKLGKDFEPVHLISHGATEAYGPNRNGDGFKEKCCQKYAHTFEKYAHWHRNHRNKVAAGDPFYGLVKKAGYNDTMRRVELLIGLFKTKEAAQKHGGLVADRELEKLARGDDIAVSMACRVPWDECSWCGHRARTREEYCTPSMCKAGGCKENLTRLVKVGGDVHQLHVDNVHPAWFDISNVWRPADRIAYGARADYLLKAARDGFDGYYGACGAQLAEELMVAAPLAVVFDQDGGPGGPLSGRQGELIKLAHGLDMLDARPALHAPCEVKRAFDRRVQGDFDVARLGSPGSKESSSALAALADCGVILPLRDFARWCEKSALAAPATLRLNGIYGRMLADGSLEGRLVEGKYSPSTQLAPYSVRCWAEGQRESFALEKTAVDARCRLSALRGLPLFISGFVVKAAADAGTAGAAEGLARDYACYKLAALHRIASGDAEFLLTSTTALAQNQVV